jgi:hypothetical protein
MKRVTERRTAGDNAGYFDDPLRKQLVHKLLHLSAWPAENEAASSATNYNDNKKEVRVHRLQRGGLQNIGREVNTVSDS